MEKYKVALLRHADALEESMQAALDELRDGAFTTVEQVVDAAAVRDVAVDLIAGGRPAVTAIGPEAEIMSNEDLAAILAGGSA